MVFKKIQKTSQPSSSPEKLIFDLPRRKIPGVLAHQSEIMREFAERAIDRPDVALQLPTGSGKTLVGTLIAEWIRRKRGERVVYLAPTKQLVNQVVHQCETKYGIQVNGFTGKASNYDPVARSEYRTAEKIAITNYSSVFNTNPFFSDADVLIIDDAHAAENYIAGMWSISLSKIDHDQANCFFALISAIRPYIDDSTSYKLNSTKEENNGWIDKLPTPSMQKAAHDIRSVLDTYADVANVWHPWSLIRDHLHGCHFYFNESEMLIRPLIPPTWTHTAFTNPRQRIYMSATLGAGGDLERLFGRKNIYRIPVPAGWDKQGVGRRLFLFPGMSLDEREAASLRLDAMKMSGRSLVLVPSNPHGEKIRHEIENKISFKTLDAKDIEITKDPFIKEDSAVAIIANRYDGIDFPGDECRLTFVEGLPTATNLQERFLMSRMAANILFNERVQTRVLQAIGRCTRSLEDYSAVIVNGLDLQDYLIDKKRRRFLHPEIQAELQFGIEQSMGANKEKFKEFLSTFFNYGEDWESANQDIIDLRDTLSQDSFPAMKDLERAVPHEIDYQKALWQGDFVDAMDAASSVLGSTVSDDLRGYRALWNYLAGSAAYIANSSGALAGTEKAESYFFAAKNAAIGLRWLVRLATDVGSAEFAQPNQDNDLIIEQVENIEGIFEKLGASHDRRYAAREKTILDGLSSEEDFEKAHVLIGELLGFNSSKRETDGSPDPWWHLGNVCLVFEDHAGAKDSSSLSVEKARQAADHPRWIRHNIPELAKAEIIPVLVTPTSTSSSGAEPHLREVYLWKLENFREWSRHALTTLRGIRKGFSTPGDIVWRAEASKKLKEAGLDAPTICSRILANPANKHFSFS